MATLAQIMKELKANGTAQTRKTFARHGAPEAMFGVKVGDLKVIAKKIKGEQALACELYNTGNGDAQYLAGMVASGTQMTKKELDHWAKTASWQMVSEYSVPGVVTESPFARELAVKWIKSKREAIATCGWCTYSGVIATRSDDELDLAEIKSLLDQVVKQIDNAPNRVRYTMNGFVISVGTYVEPLLKAAQAAARKIGVVEVDMGETACKVPPATAYIEKVVSMGRVGKKRKTMKC